jgi:hypothetical protein
MVRLTALVLFIAAACGSIYRNDPGDGGISEPPPPPDAAQLHEAREFVSGGARMTSATYRFDVQVGHAVQQGKAAGTTYQFQASPAVKP